MLNSTTNPQQAITRMPSYDEYYEELLVQRVPWSQLQNSTAMMYYYVNKVLKKPESLVSLHRHDLRRSIAGSEPITKVNSGIHTRAHSNDDDNFMMYEFKVLRCQTSRGHHDWTDCKYLHPGEKARRRDPRKYSYCGKPCAEFRKRGQCESGDRCQFAHGVFETWLHPSKYKTQMCRDEKHCTRKVCFFAHSDKEIREGEGVIEESMGMNILSPKSVLSRHQSPAQSIAEEITKDIDRKKLLSDVQDMIDSISQQNEKNKREYEEVPNFDWIEELVD